MWPIQLFDALTFLNENIIIHRDIKPNIVFLSNDKLKIADFGLSKEISHSDIKTHVGTHSYQSPQIMNEELILSTDVWYKFCRKKYIFN